MQNADKPQGLDQRGYSVYLNWSKAIDHCTEAQVAAEIKGDPFYSRRVLKSIWKAAARDCEAQEAFFRGRWDNQLYLLRFGVSVLG